MSALQAEDKVSTTLRSNRGVLSVISNILDCGSSVLRAELREHKVLNVYVKDNIEVQKRMKKSIIYSFTPEELKQIIESSNTLKEVCNKVGISNYGNSYTTLLKVINEYSLNNELANLRERSKEHRKFSIYGKEISNEKIFCENSKTARSVVRDKILKYKLLPYVCSECNISNEYNGKPLSLQLDHINGIGNDNRLENLRFLCPNCHSQTETWGGKNQQRTEERAKRKKIEVEVFSKEIETRKKYFDENIDITKRGWVMKAARDLKISHTQVKRWLNKYYPEFL